MKKLVLFVAVVVAVSFASCKKTVQEPVAPEVEDVVVVDTEVPADTIEVVEAVEAVVEEAQ